MWRTAVKASLPSGGPCSLEPLVGQVSSWMTTPEAQNLDFSFVNSSLLFLNAFIMIALAIVTHTVLYCPLNLSIITGLFVQYIIYFIPSSLPVPRCQLFFPSGVALTPSQVIHSCA